jgi:hypothetical protein
MAAEKTKGTTAKKRGMKTSPPKKKNMNGIIIAIVAVVAIVIALMIMLTLSNVPEEPVTPSTPGTPGTPATPTTDGSTLEKLLPDTADALSNIKKFSFSGELDMLMYMGADSMDAAMTVSVEYDADEEEMHIYYVTKMGNPLYGESEQESDTYILNDLIYTKIVDPSTSDVYWIKETTLEDMWSETLGTEDISELLQVTKGEVVATETVNGEQADKIMVEPDFEKLMEYAMGTQEDLFMISEAEIQEAVDLLEDAITDMDVYVWVSKSSSLPLKVSGDITAALDLGAMYGYPGEMGSIDIELDFMLDLSYPAEIDIELPAEAADAMTLTEFFETANSTAGIV